MTFISCSLAAHRTGYSNQCSDISKTMTPAQYTGSLRWIAVLFVGALLGGSARSASALQQPRVQPPINESAIEAAARKISPERLMERIQVLADDSMLGRRPGESGDTIATRYLAREMARIGIKRATPGGYLQPVALQSASATGSIRVSGRSAVVPLLQGQQVVIAAIEPGMRSVRSAPIVFVGHGIVAPEFQWDDYKGVSLAGKIALILDQEPASLRRRGFSRNASGTYHIQPFLRARHALARGAAGVILRSGTDSTHAARAYNAQHHAILGTRSPAIAASPVTVLLSTSGAEALARSVGDSLGGWRRMAAESTFKPLILPLTLDAEVAVAGQPFTSHNVLGIIPGSDPAVRDECVVYVAHWDAYGVGPAVRGDSIYNGALDNAAGVSTTLAIAEAMRALPRAPRRTTVFVATTAEETGFLGAEAYVRNPVCPMRRTALVIGMDWTWTWGRTDTLVSNGWGYSTVDSAAAVIARKMKKTLVPGWSDYWMASDQAVFLARGVPAWFGGLDGEVIGKPAGWAMQQLSSTRTHVPSDEILATWDLSGAAEEGRFLFMLGLAAAESSSRFRWTAVSEFDKAALKYDRR